MLVVIPGSIAALTSAFLLYFKHFVPLGLGAEKALGIALPLGLAFVNARGVKLGARVQNVFTVLKLTGLVAIVGLALLTQDGTAWHFRPAFPDSFTTALLPAVGVAMISTLFAYDAWHFVGFVAGEMKDPARTVPRSIFVGVAVVIAVYVSVNVAYIFVLGQSNIARSERVAADTMSTMIGPAGASFITLAILCSTFGAISANVLAGPRVFFAMARDGTFFRQLADVHPRYETPAKAIWALAGWAAVLTLTGGYEHLITMSMFANWIFFTMVVLSVVALRRKHPDWPRPYRALGYPFTVLVFVLVSSAFVVNTLMVSARSSLMGLGLLLLGVPVYLWSRRTS
jgi:APA family basic amino acid/polyamine antiporter